MATAGRILIMPKGAWAAETDYEMLDLVTHNGKAWVAKKVSVGIEPSEDNAEYWHDFLGGTAEFAFKEDIEELKHEQKVLVIPNVPLETAEAADEFFDNYSVEFENGTQYRVKVSFTVVHPIFGGSAADLIGSKTSDDYEWQMIISYATDAPKIFMRSKYVGAWTEWSTKFLPLTGGKMSGGITLENQKAFTSTDGTYNFQMFEYGKVGCLRQQNEEGTIRRALMMYPKEMADLHASLKYEANDSGVSTSYNLFGQHNKPSGTYTGNGSATSRSISIGGIGAALLIIGNTCSAIVTSYGAFGIDSDGSNFNKLTKKECNFTGGILNLATNSGLVNGSTAYAYQVL